MKLEKISFNFLQSFLGDEFYKGNHALYASLLHQALKPSSIGELFMEYPDKSIQLYGSHSFPLKARMKINSSEFFKKCLWFGDIGFGESYVAGDWESETLTQTLAWFILNKAQCPTLAGGSQKHPHFNLLHTLNRLGHRLKPNTFHGSRQNISVHYDLNVDFFKLFLDKTLTYSSACFEGNVSHLDEAQLIKYERLAEYLKLNSADHLLEIGCGWGGFSLFAAKKYGCKITAITVSKAQYDYFKRRIREEKLNRLINLQLEDYRKIQGDFDKIVSIEMIEAVGEKYLEAYFRKCHQLLKPHGLLALQMILYPDDRFNEYKQNADWIQKHIFPGSLLPSLHRIQQALRKTGDLQLFEMKDIGISYAKTLKNWSKRFHENLSEIYKLGFDENFIKKWTYYFSICEAAFQTRHITAVQAVYSRSNNQILMEIN
ncbi:MAG: class I SAM-dependent methyltransferase [Deltaproteobacteria bacterium]|nr:class I SAM-dependent methyltransferase [Deltaproteobacteria bacterium]